jgi:hypothetical protein
MSALLLLKILFTALAIAVEFLLVLAAMTSDLYSDRIDKTLLIWMLPVAAIAFGVWFLE